MSYYLDPRVLVKSYGPAVVYVSGMNSQGDPRIGSAFHIGDGWFATARHVMEEMAVRKIGRLDVTEEPLYGVGGRMQVLSTWPAWESEKIESLLFHPNDKIDLAVFKCPDFTGPTIQLHVSSGELPSSEFLLSKVLVLGYPPIPQSKHPYLVCVPCEVSAVVEDYICHKRYFALTNMARGGFSGGAVLSMSYPSRSVGVITQAFLNESLPTEFGFSAALNAALVLEVMRANNIYTEAIELTLQGFVLPEYSLGQKVVR